MYDNGLNFLHRYKCSTWLYTYIKTLRSLVLKRPVFLPVEISVKRFTDGRVVLGRYTITMRLVEFQSLPGHVQKRIFRYLGFNLKDYQGHMFDRNADIIFGQDGNVGKIYFDRLDDPLDPHLICYESTGRVKYYRPQFLSKNWLGLNICNGLNVFDEAGQRIGVHLRVNGDQGVYWYGIAADYTTEYRRPD